MHSNFIKHLGKFIDIDNNDIEILNKHLKCTSYKRKDFILTEGQICRSIFFVEKGCLRMFFINKKGAEQITQFAIENWIISDIFSFTDNKASEYYIQTIEASDVISIDTHTFELLLKEIPKTERYFRIVMQRALAATQRRNEYLYELSKEEFYTHFCNSFPEFVQRVPQYMIASYLGLTPEYVSELRKKNL